MPNVVKKDTSFVSLAQTSRQISQYVILFVDLVVNLRKCVIWRCNPTHQKKQSSQITSKGILEDNQSEFWRLQERINRYMKCFPTVMLEKSVLSLHYAVIHISSSSNANISVTAQKHLEIMFLSNKGPFEMPYNIS